MTLICDNSTVLDPATVSKQFVGPFIHTAVELELMSADTGTQISASLLAMKSMNMGDGAKNAVVLMSTRHTKNGPLKTAL